MSARTADVLLIASSCAVTVLMAALDRDGLAVVWTFLTWLSLLRHWCRVDV